MRQYLIKKQYEKSIQVICIQEIGIEDLIQIYMSSIIVITPLKP